MLTGQVWGASGKQQLGQGAESAVEGVKNQAQSAPSTAEALKHKSVIISCLLLVFQQLSGINAIVYFSSSVFAKVRSACLVLLTHLGVLDAVACSCTPVHATLWGRLHSAVTGVLDPVTLPGTSAGSKLFTAWLRMWSVLALHCTTVAQDDSRH